jgi:hypothetical protein
MVKTHQNLQLLTRDVVHELSIFSSKKRTSEILFIDKWYRPGEKQNRA